MRDGFYIVSDGDVPNYVPNIKAACKVLKTFYGIEATRKDFTKKYANEFRKPDAKDEYDIVTVTKEYFTKVKEVVE